MTLWAGGMFYRLNGDLPKVVVLLIHEMKFWLQNCHLKCICWFCGSKSEHYRFSMCFGESAEEIIPVGGYLLLDIFIQFRYLTKHPVLFFEVNPGTENAHFKAWSMWMWALAVCLNCLCEFMVLTAFCNCLTQTLQCQSVGTWQVWLGEFNRL